MDVFGSLVIGRDTIDDAFLRRYDGTARPPRAEHYSSAVDTRIFYRPESENVTDHSTGTACKCLTLARIPTIIHAPQYHCPALKGRGSSS